MVCCAIAKTNSPFLQSINARLCLTSSSCLPEHVDLNFFVILSHNNNNNNNNESLTDPNTDGFSLLKFKYLK